MSTLKLGENSFPFHSLHCKPSLANILCGQISVSEWRHSKANLGPDETTLWTGRRNSWAALILYVIWPAVHQMISPSAFSQLNPHVYIWICVNWIDWCVLEHPSSSGFVFIPGPTWHWKKWAKSQWVWFVLCFYLKSQNIFKIPVPYHSSVVAHYIGLPPQLPLLLLLVFQNLEQNLCHLCKQKRQGVKYILPTHSMELEMFSAPTSLKEGICAATLHSIILLQGGERKIGNHTLTLKSCREQWYTIPWTKDESICSPDVMISSPWNVKPYPGYHTLHDKNTNIFCICDLYVLCNINAVFHCRGHLILMSWDVDSQLWQELKSWTF